MYRMYRQLTPTEVEAAYDLLDQLAELILNRSEKLIPAYNEYLVRTQAAKEQGKNTDQLFFLQDLAWLLTGMVSVDFVLELTDGLTPEQLKVVQADIARKLDENRSGNPLTAEEQANIRLAVARPATDKLN